MNYDHFAKGKQLTDSRIRHYILQGWYGTERRDRELAAEAAKHNRSSIKKRLNKILGL